MTSMGRSEILPGKFHGGRGMALFQRGNPKKKLTRILINIILFSNEGCDSAVRLH